MLLFLSSYILLLQFPHMSANLTHNPSGWVNRIYTAQERAAIDPFKAQYMEAISPAARKIIAQVHILPALFNYWVSIGQVMDQKEMQIRTGVRGRSASSNVSSNISPSPLYIPPHRRQPKTECTRGSDTGVQ